LASIKYLKDHNELREQHQDIAAKFKTKLQEAGIEVLDNSCTHIVPVMVRDAKLCKQISDQLLDEHGIYVQPINYPTVAVGGERLRFAPTPLHTDAMIDDCVRALIKCIKD
jgi:5-aminolevulinate synthase